MLRPKGQSGLCPSWRSLAASFLLACLLPAAAAADAPPPAPLRVLMLHAHEANHGHRDTDGELQTLELFAQLRGLTLEPVYVHRPAELAVALAAGKADIAISTPATPGLAPRPRVIATEAVNRERYIVVGANTATASSPLDFAGARIGIRHSSPQWSYFEQLAAQLDGVYLEALPDYISRAEVLNLMARGVYDYTAVAAAAGEDPLEEQPRLAELFELSPEQAVHWYVAPGRVALAEALNAHLRRYQGLAARSNALLGDLDRIASRHVLRVITRIDAQNYFLKGGKPAGFEYSLVRRLGRHLGLRVEFLVAESDEQMTEWLISGYGDMISARLDGTAAASDPGVTLSRRYHFGATTIVSRLDTPIDRREDLAGRSVVVHEGSIHHAILEDLLDEGLALDIVTLPRHEPLSELLAVVAGGGADAVLVDGLLLDEVAADYPALRAGAVLEHDFDYRWAMRGQDRKLAGAVNAFLEKHYHGRHYNMVLRKYMATPRYLALPTDDRLTPYDSLIARYADRFQFDWRLIAAQLYQESQFDPLALSEAGAFGLMQMMPATALEVGFNDTELADPETAIHAGIKYLARLRASFDADIAIDERTWFALAAYNAGIARVERARRLASRLGLNPNRWFGHVEVAMRELSNPQYVSDAAKRCRCGEPIIYVRSILSMYSTYQRLGRPLYFAAGAAPRREDVAI